MNRNIALTALIATAISGTTFAAETNEVELLRSQLNAVTLRLDELEKAGGSTAPASSASSWSDKIKVKGDLRYRFQHVESEATDGTDLSTSKNIQRIRARLGVYADINDWVSAEIGMRTGDKANSGNVTIGEEFSSKDFALSLAYFTLSPADAKYGEASFGKMNQQWKNVTDLMWDSDVNPEGVAYAFNHKLSTTEFLASAGYFTVIDTKESAHDATLTQCQFAIAQGIGSKMKLTVGGSFYGYDNVTDVAGYAVDYDVAEFLTEVAFKEILPIPFKLYGNYINNTVEEEKNQGYCAGIKFGDAKKGKWDAFYDFRDLGLHAAPPAFTDSDFADGGTGIRGHRVKAQYNFAKNLAGGVTYIYSKRTPDRSTDQNQQFNTLMLDLMIKF